MSKVADLVEVTEKGAGDAILESGAVRHLRELEERGTGEDMPAPTQQALSVRLRTPSRQPSP